MPGGSEFELLSSQMDFFKARKLIAITGGPVRWECSLGGDLQCSPIGRQIIKNEFIFQVIGIIFVCCYAGGVQKEYEVV